MTSEMPKEVTDLMARHRGRNSESWSAPHLREAAKASVLLVRGIFAGRERDREGLITYLADKLGYTVATEDAEWESGESYLKITVTPPPRTWTLDGLNAWTDQMVIAGWEHGRVFFGTVWFGTIMDRSLEELKQYHRSSNRQTWAQLRNLGVNPETELALEAHFWTKGEREAVDLAEHLERHEGHAAEVATGRRGLLRRTRLWAVTATRPPQMTNPDDIDAWTDRMVVVADRFAAEFDGWGTLIPE